MLLFCSRREVYQLLLFLFLDLEMTGPSIFRWLLKADPDFTNKLMVYSTVSTRQCLLDSVYSTVSTRQSEECTIAMNLSFWDVVPWRV